MKRFLPCLLFIFLTYFYTYSQSYISRYDILEERLTLNDNGSFQFELVDPLDKHKIISGTFIRTRDTLIFNKGVPQNDITVSQCNCDFSINRDGYYAKFIDEKGHSLSGVETMLVNERLRADPDGIVNLPGARFPSSVSVSLLRLSDRLWANPYQKIWMDIPLKCDNGNGNLLIVQLNLSEDFKMPFESETKLFEKDSQLFYVKGSRLLEGLSFQLDTINHNIEGESTQKSELLTPENLFEFREVENFTRYFKPSLLDTFWRDFRSKNIGAIYNMTNEQVKKVQTLEDFNIYFQMIESFYGKIISDSVESSAIKNLPIGKERLARRIYGVSFEHCTGRVNAHFNVVNRDSVMLAVIQVETDDYTLIPKVDQITKESVSAIKSKDSKALYQQTSTRFKEYSSIAEFESFTTKLFETKVENIKLYQSSLGVREKTPIVVAIYELTDNYLRLTFVENKGSYFLEGINLVPRQ